MNGEIKSDKDYIEAFNQGYELSKELGLKPEILKDISAGNNRMQAMKEGMEQYGQELTQEKEKDILPPFDYDNLDNHTIDLETPDKSDDKGMDMDI
ncbi:MAG: hypothetical protein AAF849_00630 [Bacteroidota bacterium]